MLKKCVSAVSGGVFLGRKLLASQVQKKKAALVERAGAEVRERIRTQARDFVVDHLRRVLGGEGPRHKLQTGCVRSQLLFAMCSEFDAIRWTVASGMRCRR